MGRGVNQKNITLGGRGGGGVPEETFLAHAHWILRVFETGEERGTQGWPGRPPLRPGATGRDSRKGDNSPNSQAGATKLRETSPERRKNGQEWTGRYRIALNYARNTHAVKKHKWGF